LTNIRHAFLPDCQVKENVPLEHLGWAAEYFVSKKVDVIVCGGDFADMESLCSYDKGKKSFEGRRYKKDIEVARRGMETFMAPIRREQERLIRNKEKQWNPKMIMTLGNHENRINRATENDAALDGVISIDDLEYEKQGWDVVPFLEVRVENGIAYSHYFVSGVMGRPVTSARQLLSKHHMSCVAGHQQGKDIAYGQSADGKRMTSIISGSFYQHDEAYLTAQNNIHWRGVWLFNEIQDGSFDELPVSLAYLKRRYS
jgi:hypothetical protein